MALLQSPPLQAGQLETEFDIPAGPVEVHKDREQANHLAGEEASVGDYAEIQNQLQHSPQAEGIMTSAQEESFLANQFRAPKKVSASAMEASTTAAAQVPFNPSSAGYWAHNSPEGSHHTALHPSATGDLRRPISGKQESVPTGYARGQVGAETQLLKQQHTMMMDDLRHSWRPDASGDNDRNVISSDQLMTQSDFQMLEPYERELVLREARDRLVETRLADELIKQQSEFVDSIRQRHDKPEIDEKAAATKDVVANQDHHQMRGAPQSDKPRLGWEAPNWRMKTNGRPRRSEREVVRR